MNPIPEGTAGDERLLLLAMALDNRVGLTFDEIVEKGLLGYGKDVKTESLAREFSRYRQQLEEIGIRVIETMYGGVRRFKLDAHVTYADPQDIELSAEETLTLVTLLTLYLEDGGAPYATDARKARDKIASIAGLAAWPDRVARNRDVPGRARGLQAAAQARAASELLKAYTEQMAVSFRYTNARGETALRHVLIYGMFARHGRTYYVARDDTHGTAENNAVKLFRDDRIDARSIKPHPDATYRIPLDFTVEDYLRLPFQYGSEQAFTALFHVKHSAAHHDVAAITQGKGMFFKKDGQTLWSIEANDFPALVRWSAGALEAGLVPCEPARLIDAVRDGLKETERVNG